MYSNDNAQSVLHTAEGLSRISREAVAKKVADNNRYVESYMAQLDSVLVSAAKTGSNYYTIDSTSNLYKLYNTSNIDVQKGILYSLKNLGIKYTLNYCSITFSWSE